MNTVRPPARRSNIASTTSIVLALIGGSALSGCLVAPESSPHVDFRVDAATQYNNRGTPNVKTGVVQPEGTVSLPTKDGGVISVGGWWNMNLKDDAGNAWYPDGHSGDFTDTQLRFRYGRRLGDNTDVVFGITNYTLTDGSEFINTPAQGVRGSTNEVSLTVSQNEAVLGITPRIELHYDYDEVDGLYVRTGLKRHFSLVEKLDLDVDLHLGYSDANQSLWNYGLEEAGFADLGGDMRLSYSIDSATKISIFVAASTLVDKDLRDWFDNVLTDSGLPISSDNLWGGIGLSWHF